MCPYAECLLCQISSGGNSHLVCDPTICQPGFYLPRQQWSLLHRFRTEQGHCSACRRKWRLTLICVLVVRPRRCSTLSNPVPWQNWMAVYLGYTLRMKTLFRRWPAMVHDTHTRRRKKKWCTLGQNLKASTLTAKAMAWTFEAKATAKSFKYTAIAEIKIHSMSDSQTGLDSKLNFDRFFLRYSFVINYT